MPVWKKEPNDLFFLGKRAKQSWKMIKLTTILMVYDFLTFQIFLLTKIKFKLVSYFLLRRKNIWFIVIQEQICLYKRMPWINFNFFRLKKLRELNPSLVTLHTKVSLTPQQFLFSSPHNILWWIYLISYK